MNLKKNKFSQVLTAVSLSTLALLSATPSMAQSQDVPQVEIMFVLDTTGSMSDLIDGAKQKIWSIANTVVSIHPDADIRMGITAYRDYGDSYVTRKYELDEDLQGLYGDLMAFRADGGGDNPEAVNEALAEAVNETNWTSEEANQIIFLVGDAPPHMDYQNAKYPEIIEDAQQKGLIVNTVLAGDDHETMKYWQEIAELGGGHFVQIPQDGGQIQVINTPFDQDIIRIQSKIDGTIVPYGSLALQAEVSEKLDDKAAASESAQVENAEFYSKRDKGAEVITGGGDLVADLEAGRIALGEVKEDELPENLRGKSATEIESYVKGNANTRAGLMVEMEAVIEKRDAYIAEQLENTDNDGEQDSFDRAVQEILEEQIQ